MRHMIKRFTRARFGHIFLILLGIMVGLAYLGAPTHTPTVLAIPDQLPQVGFAQATYTFAENAGTVAISVTINQAPAAGAENNVVVAYSTLPGTAQPNIDFTPATGTLTFTSASQTTQTFNVTLLNNAVSTGERRLNLVLRLNTTGTATLARDSAELIITEDDPTPTPTIRPTAATGTPIFVDLTEPNDAFEEAYEVQPDATTTLCQLTLWPPGDLDFYTFAVKAGTYYQLTTSQLSPGIDTVLTVYNQRGQAVAENDDFGAAGDLASQLVVQADTTGMFFARVVNKSPADAANRTYCFAIDAMEQPTPTATATLFPTRTGSDICEPNGRLDIACLFGDNQSQQFNFVPPFNQGPDQDFYRIWVKPGVTITCETNQLSAVTDTNMIMLGPNGEDFNPQLGNDDKAPGDRGSRLTFTSFYTGWLHVLVGPVNPVPVEQAAQFTYTLACTSSVPPTATPTTAFVPPTTGGGGGGVIIAPTITPLPTPTPFDLSQLLTPSPVVIPEVTIQPLPTATPATGAQGATTVNVTVFYDSNFNFTPEINEGIENVAVALYDNTNGRLLAFGYTNKAGVVRFEAIPSSGAVRVEVPLLKYTQIVGTGESNIGLRVAPLPLPIGIP